MAVEGDSRVSHGVAEIIRHSTRDDAGPYQQKVHTFEDVILPALDRPARSEGAFLTVRHRDVPLLATKSL